MEKFLKPTKLELDPRTADCKKAWTHWKQTLDNFFGSFSTTPNDAAKLSALVNFVSPDVYAYIDGSPDFTTAIAALQAVYIKPKNEIYARHCLLTRKQQEGENIDEFMRTLEKLSKECEFKDVGKEDYRKAYIRDAFICGISSPEIRQKLLEENLDIDKSFEKARTYELAMLNSQRIGSSNVVNATVPETGAEEGEQDKVCAAMFQQYNNRNRNSSKGKSGSDNCFYCGYQSHSRDVCPARNQECNFCGFKGHFERACRTRAKTGASNGSYKKGNYNKPRADKPSYSQAPRLVSALPTSLADSVVSAKVRDRDVNVLIDSGSTESYINLETVKLLNLGVNSLDCENVKMASSRHSSTTLGSTKVDVTIGEHTYSEMRLKILPDLCCDIIMGHDVMNQHDKVVINFGGRRSTMNIDNISPSGFACSLSPMSIGPAHLFEHLSPDLKPIRCNSRQYSKPDTEFISQEVSKLLSDGRIEPSTSPWRAQVLVTSNERHRKRMVVDYSRTINKYCELDGYPFPNIDEMVNKVAQYTFYSTYDLKSAYHQVPIRESDRPFTAFEAAGRLYQFTCIPYGVSNGVAAFQRSVDGLIDSNNLKNTFAYIDNITICGHTREELDSHVKQFMEVVDKFGMTLNHDKTIEAVKEIKILGYQVSKGTIKPDPDRMGPLTNMPLPSDPCSLKRALGLFSYYSRWIPNFSEKIRPLSNEPDYPLNKSAEAAFEEIKQCIKDASLVSPNESDLLVVETDASDFCLSASLNQNGRPVAFFSRTLNCHEKHHSSVEKEACSIVEAVRKWRHYLCGRRFLLLTDQQAVSFIFNPQKLGKIKNDKLLRWRIELSCFTFDIKFRPGRLNYTADCLSRASTSTSNPLSTTLAAVPPSQDSLVEIHEALCHPGITRMTHLVRSRNLPYSVEDVKRVISRCTTCAKLKPVFYTPKNPPLIKATQPLERISIDFKGPLPSSTANKYILTVIDEYSRFPFAFPCKDLLATTVKKCLTELFSLFGPPGYVHSDRGKSFISELLRTFLVSQGIGSSFTTPYNPRGNGQCERYNGVIWKTVQLALATRNLEAHHWEVVLPDALHAIRSLLCTATNMTPHEKFLGFTRRSAGAVIPSWLLEKGKALLRRHVRASKYEPLVEEVDIIETNPCYARVCLENGTEKNVSLRDLAPLPRDDSNSNPVSEPVVTTAPSWVPEVTPTPISEKLSPAPVWTSPASEVPVSPPEPPPPEPEREVRQSSRVSVPPDRMNYHKLGGT